MKETILENGLTIITDNNDNSKVCTLGYIIKSGSYDELDSERGIAHLIEHMMFKGTIHRDYQTITKEIESIGGYFNAMTSFEYTKYYCTVPYNKWEIGLDVLSDMLFNHTFPEDELKKEKNVVQEELIMYNDDPESFVNFKSIEEMFKKYPNRMLIGGSVDSVNKLTRDDMLEFVTRNYFPENMIFLATGNIKHDDIVNFIKNYIDELNINFNSYQKQYDKFKSYKLNNEVFQFKRKDVEQTHICFGLFGPGFNDKNIWPLQLLITILGGNCSSILYNIIREQKGLAYHIGMDIEILSDVSIITGYAGLNNKNDIIKEILEQIKNAKDIINEEILESAKQYSIGMLYLSLEKTSSVHNILTERLIHNNKDDIDTIINTINSVTLENIYNVLETYFIEDNMCFVKLN